MKTIATCALTAALAWPALAATTWIPLDQDFGEYTVAGEEEATQKLLTLFSAHMKKKYADPRLPAKRAVHAKDHGCLDATFEVFDHGYLELKFGLFREPSQHAAFVRFSNGDGPPGKDTDKTISVGMAIKVLDVGQTKLLPEQAELTQDLLMINQPAFLVKDVVEFADLIQAREGGPIDKGLFALSHRDGLKFRKSASPKDDPLNTPFWSVLAFRLGNTAVKYMVQPCRPIAKVTGSSPNFLTELVRGHIEREAACFDFFLQKRVLDGTEVSTMPIENARVIWDETKSKPIRVAQLRIPRQSMVDTNRRELCESSEFSPWNTTLDFRPLGNLNRIRRTVYELSARERHRLNNTQDPFHN